MPAETADSVETDTPGPRPSWRRRRLIRWTAIVAALILAFLACMQDPVYSQPSPL
ncbi:hypothetical protein WEI85_15990 [Actinomycetes bacterium KLBMP 9797]